MERMLLEHTKAVLPTLQEGDIFPDWLSTMLLG